MWWVVGAIGIGLTVLIWSCCVVAGKADEDAGLK